MKHAPARRSLGRTPRIPRFAGRATRRRSRGQTIVEFAVVLPIILMFLLIGIDAGRAFFTWVQLNNAAREGAAYAAANPTDSAPGGGIWSRVAQEKNAQSQVGEGATTVTVSCTRGGTYGASTGVAMPCADSPGGVGAGNFVTVSVAEPFSFVTPLVPLMNSLSSMFGFSPLGSTNGLTLRTSATAAVLGLAATGNSGAGSCTAQPQSAAFAFTADVANRTVTVDATASQLTSGINAITGYNWDWGDGSDPYLQEGVHQSHVYSSKGVYTVALTVENPCGSLSTTETVDLTDPPTPPPTAEPTATTGPTPSPTPTPTPVPTPTPTPTIAPTPTPGSCTTRIDFTFTVNNANKKVTFYASYTGQPQPSSWTWDFDHGSSQTTTQTTVTHDYPNTTATYHVTLSASNGTCVAPSVSHDVSIVK